MKCVGIPTLTSIDKLLWMGGPVIAQIGISEPLSAVSLETQNLGRCYRDFKITFFNRYLS